MVTVTIFLTILIALMTWLMIHGFAQTQQAGTIASQQGLDRQGQAALLGQVQREAELRTLKLEQIAVATRVAVAAFNSQETAGVQATTVAFAQLALTPAGVRFDPTPERVSDVWLPPHAQASLPLQRAMQQSKLLDSLFPGLLQEHDSAVAAYYISPSELLRYYPAINVHDVAPADIRITEEDFFRLGTPDLNPQRATVWTPVYVDPAGQGLLLTAISPVYTDDVFAGVINIDLSLDALVASILAIHPSPHGYALLLDTDGNVIAAPPAALETLFAVAAPPTLTETLDLQLNIRAAPALNVLVGPVKQQETGIQSLVLNAQQFFVAYAPLSNVGWSLVLVAPVSEVTAEAQAVTTAITAGSEQTIRQTLLWLGLLAAMALCGGWLLIRRLSLPIFALLQGTRQLAAADFQVLLPVGRSDELGLLAHTFNHMAGRVAESQQRLQLINQNLEQTVQLRTQELELERQSLQQALDDLSSMSLTVARLTTPVIPVLKEVVVVPVIGSLDHERTLRLQTEVLRAVERLHLRLLIFDLTGVTYLMPDSIGLFMRMLDSLRLLGARSMLVGVHPELAQQLVQSGIDVSLLDVKQDLQTAISAAFQGRL